MLVCIVYADTVKHIGAFLVAFKSLKIVIHWPHRPARTENKAPVNMYIVYEYILQLQCEALWSNYILQL